MKKLLLIFTGFLLVFGMVSQAGALSLDLNLGDSYFLVINEEVDGTIKNLPLLQKWLHRVRGPVVTKKPVGTNPNQ